MIPASVGTFIQTAHSTKIGGIPIMKKNTHLSIVAGVAVLALFAAVACGGQTKAPETPAAQTTESAPAAPAAAPEGTAPTDAAAPAAAAAAPAGGTAPAADHGSAPSGGGR